MRIRTRLLVAASCAVLVALIVLASLWHVTQSSAGHLRSQGDAQEIARNVANLLTLTQEATLYGGERVATQWRARQTQLRQTVEQALAKEAEPHPALVEMHERVRDLLPLYERLEETFGARGAGLAERRRDLLVERLVSETQELVDARHRWATAIIERQAQERHIENMVVLGGSAILVLLIVGLALAVDRRGLVPLARLQAASAAIQRGDLSVRCETGARDELGDTARAVNAMADSLLAVNAALRESQERYELAVAGSDDGVFDWDYRTGRAFGSARARAIFGLPPGPEMQSTAEWFAAVEAQLHPDDVVRRRAAIEAHMSGRAATYEGEFRVRNPAGSYRWVRVRGLSVRHGNEAPHRMAGSVSDIDARKRAEESLRQSEERYALAMTGSRGGHWVWEVETDALFVSGTVNQLFGLPEDTRATTRQAYFAQVRLHPDDQAQIARVEEDIVVRGAPRADFEYRIILRDGTQRWILTRAQCFRDAAGKPVRVAGVSVDIGERKRTEALLRQSEERFALAVAGSSDGILDWDIEHDRMFTSERAMQITGVPPGPTVRSRAEWIAQLKVHPDDRARHDEAIRSNLAGETAVRDAEHRVLHPDGVYRWVRVRGTCVRDATGRAIRWAGSISDIDARKRAEEALRKSEARYQLAVEGANQGLWDWDLQTDDLFVSQRAQVLLGLAPGEPLRPRRAWIERLTLHPEDADAMRAAISSHLHGRTQTLEIEFRMQHPSGTWHWYRQRGAALRDEQGRPYRVAGSMEDITPQKTADAERIQLETQLLQAKKLEAIGTLAGGIAHDFNNILAAILGNGEMAQSEAPAGTPLRRHVDAIVTAGLRAKSLVERILAFSRGGMAERLPVHVQSVVEEALHLVTTSLPARVHLERRLAARDARVLGDATQIHQVVMNLCTNAVQAMPAQGVLSVELDVAERDETVAATSTLAGGRYVRLRVRDTGTGIAPDALERIFDPFFTTKGVGVGTGLGLSLVHGIVTDLGGGIDVESSVGQGTTISVYLPWNSDGAQAVDGQVVAPTGAGETILLVDDEEPLVILGEEMLARLGYEPVGFTSSVTALAAFRAAPQRFQVVLADQAMPDMNGVELARAVRSLRPDMPVVLMSGFVNAALMARASDVGIVEVLAKPLVARDLARRLATVLGPVDPAH